jgi:hypothetical protein
MLLRAAKLSALAVVAVISCSGPNGGGVPAGPPLAVRQTAAADALRALRESKFEEAGRLAGEVLRSDPDNPFAGVVAAISRFKAAGHQLVLDVTTIAIAAFRGGLNERYLRSTLETAESELARADQELRPAARFPDFALELCPACLEVDWNHNGRVDNRDRRFLEVELGADGQELPAGDPRRRPVFRFDHGDVLWARAFLAFQRAGLDLLLAFAWGGLNPMMGRRAEQPPRVVITLDQPGRVAKARELILSGLDLADQARLAYLAETDDDREWVPSPRQRSHPLPLPVDDELYRTWELVLGDLRRLVRGEEGLSVAELAQLGDHHWRQPPRGYLDIGRMLERPRTIVLDLAELRSMKREERLPKEMKVEAMLRSVLGEYYRDSMKPSPLLGRLARMKAEVKHGKERLDRKLRYLLWLN